MSNQTSLDDSYGSLTNTPTSGKGLDRNSRPVQNNKKIAPATIHTFKTFTVFADTVVRTLIGANKNRRYLSIQNNGVVDVFVSYGGVAQVNGDNAERMPPNAGKTFEFGIVPNNEITVIATANCRMSITEGFRS